MRPEGIFTKKTIIFMVFLVNIPSDRVKQLFWSFSMLNQYLFPDNKIVKSKGITHRVLLAVHSTGDVYGYGTA